MKPNVGFGCARASSYFVTTVWYRFDVPLLEVSWLKISTSLLTPFSVSLGPTQHGDSNPCAMIVGDPQMRCRLAQRTTE